MSHEKACVLLLTIAAALPLILCGCRSGADVPDPRPAPQPPPNPVGETTVDALVNGHTGFGLSMLNELTGGAPEENVFISPASIALALSMTLNGAAGETRQAMLEALQLEGLSPDEINAATAQLMVSLAEAEPAVALSIANSLWAREGINFLPEFTAANETYYQAEVSTLDFADAGASKTINAWVAEQTRDKIETIVPDQLDPMAIMFLINAIYFKGEWDEPFEEDATQDGPFTLLDGTQASVPLMSQHGEYYYAETDAFQAVRLPYKDHRVRMLVFLPKSDSSLAEFAASLTPGNWEAWAGLFEDREGHVKLPRFTLEYGKKLKDPLSAMGMARAFSSTDADFSAMTDVPAFISDVVHKTFVEVNEQGTEAAAVTSVEMEMMAAPMQEEPPFEMIVDRPFCCAIEDRETGSILFIGMIVDPS